MVENGGDSFYTRIKNPFTPVCVVEGIFNHVFKSHPLPFHYFFLLFLCARGKKRSFLKSYLKEKKKISLYSNNLQIKNDEKIIHQIFFPYMSLNCCIMNISPKFRLTKIYIINKGWGKISSFLLVHTSYVVTWY